MTYRISNRKAIKPSIWLINAATLSWQELQPAPREELKLQQFDLSENINTSLAIQHFNDAFERIIQDVGGDPDRDDRVTTDAKMSVAIHKALNGLNLREASDADFWAYLTCVGCPQYVRWRWETQKPSALWTRFAGNIRKNAISRLWWWAEITCNHDLLHDDPLRYEVTKKVQGRQSLMLWFVDCAFSGHALVARQLAAIQESQLLNDSDQKAICRTVNRLARVVCLDSINTNEESENLCRRALTISRLLQP